MGYNIFKFSRDLDEWFNVKVDKDIGPVAKKDDDDEEDEKKKKKKKNTWVKSGAFDDGYQFGDVLKSVGSTAADVGVNVAKGAYGLAEGVSDLILHGVAGVSDLVGADDFADRLHKSTSKNQTEELFGGWKEAADKNSFFGETLDSVAQGVGQVGTIILTGGIAGAAGASAAGASATTTGLMGLSSMGSGIGEAYQSGASDGEAFAYGAMKGVVDAGTELIFGGLGKAVKALGISRGLTSVDDMFAKKLSSKISSQFWKNATEYTVKASAEGLEEVLAGYGSAVAKKLTYMSDEELEQLVKDEKLLEQFVVGAMVSGIAQSGDLVKSNKQGRDFITNRTTNEDKVFEAEYEKRVAAEEKEKGKELTKKQKNEIYEQVQEDLQKGYISTDTIESVLGGDTYKSYKDTIDSEDAILKEYEELGKKQNATLAEQSRYAELKEIVKDIESNSKRSQLKTQLSEEVYNSLTRQDGKRTQTDDFLIESYNEVARSGQAFKVDLSKYEGKEKEVLQDLMKKGQVNNTRRAHEFWEYAAKVAAERGRGITSTTTEEILEMETKKHGAEYVKKHFKGVIPNGYIMENGDIAINVNSPNARRFILGHEIGHQMENTADYGTLKDLLYAYAESKEGKDAFKKRKDTTDSIYGGIEGADADVELTNDLIGEYLYGDEDFVYHLSTKNPNLFQKIWNEIKYLYKMATAGSQEQRDLLRIQKTFEKVYRESAKTQNEAKGNTDYSLSIKHTDGTVEELADARNLTNDQAVEYLTQAKEGKLQGRSYIPVRKDTPQVIIDTLEQVNENVSDRSLIMQVRKARQSMSVNKDNSRVEKYGGNVRSHGLSPEQIIEIVNKLDEPTTAIYQTNRQDKNGKALPNNVAFFVEYNNNGAEGVAVIEFDSVIDPDAIGTEFGDTSFHTVVTVFEPDAVRDGMEFDYVEELLANPNNIELDIKRRQSTRSATRENHPNTSSKLPSDAIISQNSEKSIGNSKFSLSAEQKEYFKDSVVRDENGDLKVMYHGTSKGGHTVFDTFGSNYGLFGQGSYFTDDKSVAESYTKKGKGNNPQVYESYLNITNPMDMDAEADIKAWMKAVPDADFSNCVTNEDCYRAMEEYLMDEEYSKWEAAEFATDSIMGMGYDGITHIGGGRFNKADETRHRVYIAFNPEQIKNIDNVKPTDNPDIRYSLSNETDQTYLDAVERGDTDAVQRMVDEAASEAGYKKLFYHGTPSGDFTKFKSTGKPMWITESKEYAEVYADNNRKTDDYKRILPADDKRVMSLYAKMDSVLDLSQIDTMDRISEFNAPSESLEKLADIVGVNTSELEKICKGTRFEELWELVNTKQFADIARKKGYDVIKENEFGNITYGVLDNTQLKSAEAITYDKKNKVIPLSERFNTKNEDIRYSLTQDSEGAKLTEEQSDFFKNTKALDSNGNLLKVYHTTNNDFTVFDKSKKGEATGDANTYLGFFFSDDPEHMQNFPGFENGKTEAYYLNMTNPIDMTDISKEAFLDVVEVLGGDVNEAAELYDQELANEQDRAKLRGDNNTSLMLSNLLYDLTGDYYYADFFEELKPHYDELMSRGYDGVVNYLDELLGTKEYIVLDSNQAKLVSNLNPTSNEDIRYSLTEEESTKLGDVGLQYDAKSETVSFSMSSLEEAFNYHTDVNGDLLTENDYIKARDEYVNALAKSIAEDKENPTAEEKMKASKYLDGLFLVHDMIAADRDRLDYEAAVNKSAWVSNSEYGGSIDFSTLCAKRRLFTGTFDAIQNALPDTVLNENDFLKIRDMLLEKELESPCSMCYVEGSRAKHGEYVDKWLKEYLKTNPEWKPQIADFTNTTRLEQTRINHPEAYAEYQKAMNKLAQRKPKEASVRTDYKGEILVAFADGSSVEIKNKNGGIRFNSFSDFEIIHALDCMQVITDMARVGLNGQAYTKVKEFAESFGNTGLKINLSLVAKDVDENGNLIMDEVNGMNYAEAMDIRNRYSENVGTVIVVFNDAQLKAALADPTIDYVLPFHRSQWKKSQYAMMGLPTSTKDYTALQNDRIRNPKTGKPVKLSKLKHIATYSNDITGETYEIKDNIMPNQYWDYNRSGRDNANRYLDYINANGMTPKFDFLLDRVDGTWVLPEGAVGDGYFKLLIDFKMYNNDGWGSPQSPVLPEFNMPYIQRMLDRYIGGHQAFPVAHDVVNEFVEGKKNGSFSLSMEGDAPIRFTDDVPASDMLIKPKQEDIAPVREDVAPVDKAVDDDIAPTQEFEAIKPRPEELEGEEAQWAKNKMARADKATTEEQQTAQILTEEPETAKKKSRGWSKFKANFLDKGAVFEDLSLKTKNRKLMAKWNHTLSSESRAQWMIGNGREGVKSLNAIREEVEKTGLTKEFYEYLYHKHNIDRMNLEGRYEDVENKPVFGYDVTAEKSQEIVNQYEFAEPKFKEYAQDVYDYMNYLRKQLVDNGVISQETADLWAEMYPHYVPIRRAGDSGLNISVPLDTGRTGVNAPIKQATGGNRDILPLFDTMAMRTEQTFKAIARNSFGVELKNTLGTGFVKNKANFEEVVDSIEKQEELLQKGENGRNPTFTVFENGEKVTFEITEDMYDALKPTSEGLRYTNKAANTISNVHRGLLTEYNPVFTLTNAIKDVQDVLINSKHARKTYAAMPRAVKELSTKGKWYTEYMENGGEQNTYFDGKTNTFKAEDEGMKKVIGMPLRAISAANDFVERAPRLAEYIASREAGASIEEAMLDAARVTTNFAAGGDVTKFLNRNGATFLNASVQGAMQQVRNVREAKANGLKGWVQLATKFAIAGLGAELLNHLLWEDDEEYEELSDYVKQNYYVVAKYGDGQFVRIPKGRALAVIQNAFEQVGNAMTGDDEVDLKSFLDLAVTNLAPNNPVEDNILAPIIQVANNKTWYGEDLVPTRLQDLPASEQFDESTDSISKWLGENFDISPYKINYLLNQYSGGIGDVALPMLTPEAESGNNSIIGNMTAPLKDKFTTNSTMNNQNVSDFYDTMDELTVNAKASTATDEDILKYKYFNSVNSDLGKLYAMKREVQNSDLPDDKKYDKVFEIQEEINALARKSLNTYNNVYIEGDYAEIGDLAYKLNKNGEWQKITDDQRDKQEAVMEDLGISASDYWSDSSEYNFASKYPDRYAVAKSVGGYDSYKNYMSDLYDIKADKDEYGKSISGSRKEKVLDYINNLDADYGTRIILYKSEYKADDRYNYDIINYLESRDDISYEEMVAILKELGFSVSSDGYISWD